MLHDHVIERAAVQRVDNVFDILAADGLVRRIHQHGLVIEQDIAVVGHTARNREKVFKSAQAAVAAANINEIFLDLSGTVHRTTPPCVLSGQNYTINPGLRPPRHSRENHVFGQKNVKERTAAAVP